MKTISSIHSSPIQFAGSAKQHDKPRFPTRKGMAKILAGTAVATELAAKISPKARVVHLLTAAASAKYVDDVTQTEHSLRRAHPVSANFRYGVERIRNEVRQYFIEDDTDDDGVPFNRLTRDLIYQRAKGDTQKISFGTRYNAYKERFMSILQSLAPLDRQVIDEPRVSIGNRACKQPYNASILNVSSMSYGSLSANAVEAINKGAKIDNFAQNTGEGGISPHHLHGGDLIWQIGTGYFGCRDKNGNFDLAEFAKEAKRPEVKMIELKLSQGAKPGLGGVLLGDKVTEEVSQIRKVPLGENVISPPFHTLFNTPKGLLENIAKMKKASGGKPVGFKLCVGQEYEFLAICKAMREYADKNQYEYLPDYITVDGSEGGTGAAPPVFVNKVGVPMRDGLHSVVNALQGFGLKDNIKIAVAGKLADEGDIFEVLARGADFAYSARPFLFSLGCIQALECHSNTCPTGITTHNPELTQALVVEDKAPRTANYHHEVVDGLKDIMAGTGVASPKEITAEMVKRRQHSGELVFLNEENEYVKPGGFIEGNPNFYQDDPDLSDKFKKRITRQLKQANPESFRPANGLFIVSEPTLNPPPTNPNNASE